MKRKLTALLIGSLVAGLTACGGGGKTESVAEPVTESATESTVEESIPSSETQTAEPQSAEGDDPSQSIPDTEKQEDASVSDASLEERTLDDIWTTYIRRGEVKERHTYEPPVKFAFMDLDWDNMPVKDTPPVFYPEEFESGLVMPFINNDLTKFDFSASSAGRVTGAELDSDNTLFDSSLWVTAVKTGPEMADQYFSLTSRLDRPATVKEILESNDYILEPLNYAYYAFGLPLPEGMSRKSIDHFKEIVDHLGRPDAILIEKTTQSIDPEGQMDAELFWIYDDFAIHIDVHDGRQKDADDYFDFTVTIIAKEAINSYAEKVCDRDDLYRYWK